MNCRDRGAQRWYFRGSQRRSRRPLKNSARASKGLASRAASTAGVSPGLPRKSRVSSFTPAGSTTGWGARGRRDWQVGQRCGRRAHSGCCQPPKHRLLSTMRHIKIKPAEVTPDLEGAAVPLLAGCCGRRTGSEPRSTARVHPQTAPQGAQEQQSVWNRGAGWVQQCCGILPCMTGYVMAAAAPVSNPRPSRPGWAVGAA